MVPWTRSATVALSLFSLFAISFKASAQSGPVALPLFAQPRSQTLYLDDECLLLTRDLCDGLPEDHAKNSQSESYTQPGAFHRGFHRLLRDEGELLRAPFQRSAIGWDVGVLVGTGALLATDKRVMTHFSRRNETLSGNISNGSIYGIAAAAGGVWIAGLKNDDPHQKETGLLTLEALVAAMGIYTPMQLIAGRERPDDAAGHGRFFQKHWIDGSFPAGHPMFAWTMAAVVAHEYPRLWVKLLFYGAAGAITVTRLTGRDHFPSDIEFGSVLGYFIGRHIFHAHCDPTLSEACH